MGGGVWRSTVQGVAKSQTRLSTHAVAECRGFLLSHSAPSISWAPVHPWRSPSSLNPEIVLLGFSCFPSSLEKSHSTLPSHAQQHITVASLPAHLPAPRSTKRTTPLPVRQRPLWMLPATCLFPGLDPEPWKGWLGSTLFDKDGAKIFVELRADPFWWLWYRIHPHSVP